jgi:hypothetical protein
MCALALVLSLEILRDWRRNKRKSPTAKPKMPANPHSVLKLGVYNYSLQS